METYWNYGIAILFAPSGQVAENTKVIAYLSNPYSVTFFIFLLLCQAALWRAAKGQTRRFNITTPIALIADSLLGCLLFLELVLSTGMFDNDPRWIPLRFQEEDKKIAASQRRNAASNPIGFNDKAFSLSKPAGVRRVAVISDSFIFGDGVPYEEIWGVKLRNLLAADDPNIETLLWGKNGWATYGQLKFLKDTGIQFKPDFLIIGFVTNDPSPCVLDCIERPRWHESPAWQPLEGLFPESFNFVSAFANRFIESNSTTLGYDNYENIIYSSKNLAWYASLLEELSQFCKAHNIPVLVVLTPNDYSEIFERKYRLIKPLMERAGLPVLDLLPVIRGELGHIPAEKLRASRANGHPGPLMTTLYAQEVFKSLQKRWSVATPPAPPYSRPP